MIPAVKVTRNGFQNLSREFVTIIKWHYAIDNASVDWTDKLGNSSRFATEYLKSCAPESDLRIHCMWNRYSDESDENDFQNENDGGDDCENDDCQDAQTEHEDSADDEDTIEL